MPARLLLIVTLIMAALMFGCSSSSDSNSNPVGTPTSDNANGAVRSDTSGVIQTAAGAHIIVPVGAVPTTTDGQVGTMVFSIERTTAPTINNPPSNMSTVGNPYRFGPEGFVFARPVEVGIPVEGNYQAGELLLARIDPTTGEPHFMNGSYDSTNHVVSAQTYEMSIWQVYHFAGGAEANYYGRIDLQNLYTDETWVSACIETYNLENPGDAGNFNGSWAAAAPVGNIGWNSTIAWYVPQGTYTLCVSNFNRSHPETARYITMSNVVVSEPWTSSDPQVVPLAVGPNNFVNGTPGSCACTPVPTPSAGTGAIQVTLTWHNAASIDLDLWVTDPAGERCYYGNPISTSGGHLDRDNYCGNYLNGQPENIYWSTNPPTGEYIVQVDWYSDCANNLQSQAYDLRSVVQGRVQTVTGTITRDQTVEALRFSVSHAGPQYLPPQTGQVYLTNKPPKF